MFTPLRFSAVLLMTCCAHAVEQAPADPDLPHPFDPQVLSGLLTHSPFNRYVNMEETFQLTGVAYVDGKPMATLVNRDTKQRFVVSEEPNAMGWTLTDATVSDEPSKTEAHVMIGGEEVVMHYGAMQLTPGASKGGKAELATKNNVSSRSLPNGDSGEVDVASMLGNKGKALFNSLSVEDRAKLSAIVKSSAERHPERSKEEMAAVAQKIYTKMKASESKPQGSSSSKTPRSEKPSKRK